MTAARQSIKQRIEMAFDSLPADITDSLNAITEAVARLEQLVLMQITLAQQDAADDTADQADDVAEKARFARLEAQIESIKTAVQAIRITPEPQAEDTKEMDALARIEGALRALQPRKVPESKPVEFDINILRNSEGFFKTLTITEKR